MKKIVRFVCSLVLLFAALLAASQAQDIHGRVTDSEGATISGAHVLVHPDFAGTWYKDDRKDAALVTNSAGEFRIALPSGFWDVCVMADAFAPRCQKVNIGNEKTTSLKFVLPVSREVSKLLGDAVK